MISSTPTRHELRPSRTDDVLNVAKKYLDLDHLAIIVVADRAKVEPSLRKLSVGKNIDFVRFDDDLRIVPAEPSHTSKKVARIP